MPKGRNTPHTIESIFALCRKTRIDCLEFTGASIGNNYRRIKLFGKRELAHRAVWILVFGPIQKEKNVLHTCDNPPCVNPNHLFIGTQLENMRDCIEKGRFKIGGKQKSASPTVALQLYSSGLSRREVAITLKVSLPTIARYLREVRK